MSDRLGVGDRVRIDIPHEDDPDHHLHGEHGHITTMLDDNADESTGDTRDSTIYRIELDEQTVDMRWRDLRPPID